jgi:1-acyl-sn-glycerol-3-phosphate acyltransferase
MLFVRTLTFNALFTIATAILSLLATPWLLMPYRAAIWYKQLWLHIVLGLTRLVIGIDCEERGRENIPDGPVIFAAKHQSAWDTLWLGLKHPFCAFVLKRELIWLPIWGWYLLRLGMIPIDRSKGVASLKKITVAAGKLTGRGQSILIFPQGTRTPPGADRRYLPGVAALYKGANVPVVPIALNSGLFWPRKLGGTNRAGDGAAGGRGAGTIPLPAPSIAGNRRTRAGIQACKNQRPGRLTLFSRRFMNPG